MAYKYKHKETEYIEIAHEVLDIFIKHNMGKEETRFLLGTLQTQIDVDIPLKSIEKELLADLNEKLNSAQAK